MASHDAGLATPGQVPTTSRACDVINVPDNIFARMSVEGNNTTAITGDALLEELDLAMAAGDSHAAPPDFGNEAHQPNPELIGVGYRFQ